MPRRARELVEKSEIRAARVSLGRAAAQSFSLLPIHQPSMDADLFDFLAPASKVGHTSSASALAKKRKKDKSSSRSSRTHTPAAASASAAPEASGSGSRSLSPSSEDAAATTKSKKPRVSQASNDEPAVDPMASVEASGSGAPMAVDGELVTPAVEQQQQQDSAPLPVVADEFSEETARVVEPSKAGLSAPVPEGEQAEGGGIKLTHQVSDPPQPSSTGSRCVALMLTARLCPPVLARSATGSPSRPLIPTRLSRSTSLTTRPRGRTRSSSTRSRRSRWPRLSGASLSSSRPIPRPERRSSQSMRSPSA